MRILVRVEGQVARSQGAVHNVADESRLLDELCRAVVDRGTAETYISELKGGGYRLDWSNQAQRLVVHRPTRHHPSKKVMLNLMHNIGIDNREEWEESRDSLGF